MSLIHGTINEGHLLQMKVKMAVNNHCRFGEVYFLKKQPINQNISCIGFSTLYKDSLNPYSHHIKHIGYWKTR